MQRATFLAERGRFTEAPTSSMMRVAVVMALSWLSSAGCRLSSSSSEMSAICRRLLFTELPISEPTDGALFVQPSVAGNSAILLNEYDEESRMNLELLFNGVLAEREKFAQVFNH